ncbi:transmembrane emp24 domain-containing protein 5-like [Hyposmocoma kahamanoa]|uniref:transmembrane emp24 domain-containing protein 5-like n=1 Tax=Hyposmocoma kahamanoa TaxID=1477025 RepID=UPI000E6D9824|nr:transmembrane emp24 domain-containing protein 5-like [Hyposmocoma kahamanoa]
MLYSYITLKIHFLRKAHTCAKKQSRYRSHVQSNCRIIAYQFNQVLEMYRIVFYILVSAIWKCCVTEIYNENDMNLRVEAGSRTCFYEEGKAGQMLEVQYEVVDGQHGDWDISFEILDPHENKLLEDYKKTRNQVIFDLEVDGEYVFCLDNTFSLMNSKLVFVYVLFENKEETHEGIEVSVVDQQGHEQPEHEVLEWEGVDNDGKPYFIEVTNITNCMTRILKNVVKARHLLDLYAVSKTRDSYLAIEDTFIVDMWSGFQISFMLIVGMVQVYMIKKLFDRPGRALTF